MSLIDITPSDRWRRLLSDKAAVYETSRFDHSPDLLAPELAIISNTTPKRVEDFAAGRLCARRALAELGYPPAPLLRAPDRRPDWPPGSHGSITHTQGHCAAAVALASDCAGVGIDAEVAGRVDETLERRICTPAEIVRLRRMDEAERRLTATVIFSAKEAFYKCQSHLEGAVRGFHEVEIELSEGVFQVLPQRDLPRALRSLGSIEGRFCVDQGLVFSGIMLPP